jgi:hypothetical protein
MLPLASIIASATGVLLMFWHKLMKLFRAISGRFRSSDRVDSATGKASS